MLKAFAGSFAAAVLALAVLAGGPALAEDAAGDWIGTITPPTGPLHIAVHLQAKGGALTGTADSPDQGAFDLPLAHVAASPDHLSFDVPVVHGVYAGQWDAAAQQWVGQFTQGAATFALKLARGTLPPKPAIAGLDGDWSGTLNVGPGRNLRLIVRIRTGAHGTTASLESVDQGGATVPADALERKGDHVTVSMDALDADYQADLIEGGKTLKGTFTQGPTSFPLVLNLGAPGAAAPPAPAPQAQTGPAPWTAPTDAAIDQILNERIDVEKQGVGIVVGLIDASGRRFISEGTFDQADDRPVGADTVFEMGSITKVFTAILLTDAARRGEVKLDDPVARYLPSDVHVPERGGRQITLRDLATHTSGLPRLPTNFAPADMGNPYKDYTEAQLYAFLNGYVLPRDIGSKWEYSNLGVGLLGQALARRAGMSYEALVKTRILDPLGMTSSGITLTPDERKRLAVGHDAYLRPTPYWDLPTLAGAGALRSDANDMLTFLAANIGLTPTPLKPAMDAALAVRSPVSFPGGQQALGWEVRKSPYGDIVSKNGGTGGFRTMIAFNPSAKAGVVVLTNAGTQTGGDDIAMHILAGAPLAKLAPPGPPPAEHSAITLPPGKLEALMGRYQLAPGVGVEITARDGHLFAQITGQPAVEVFPESDTEVFWKIVDAQASFQLGPDGHATGLVLHQAGRELPAKRLP